MVGILNGDLRSIGWQNFFGENDKFVENIKNIEGFIFEIFSDLLEIKLEILE